MAIIILLTIVVAVIIISVSESNARKERIALISSVTDINRGEKSELSLILWLLKSGYPSDCLFHDLYVANYYNKFSQIDLVLLTKVGIIVFEVKDYSGWLFGRGNQDKWTQVLNFGKEKHRFYNPIKQNFNHINVLKRVIGEAIPFYSIIVFFGDSVLKDISFVPQNTFVTKHHRVLEVVNHILNNNIDIKYRNIDRIKEILRKCVANGNVDNQIKHKNDIKDMLGKDRIYS